MTARGSPTAAQIPPLMSVQRAAEMLDVSPKSIYRYIDEGKLRATRLGPRTLRVYADSVTALIDAGDSHPCP